MNITCFPQATYFTIASMSQIEHAPQPKLQPPGNGLPKHELFFARILVGIKLRTTSYERASKIFADEAGRILDLVERLTPTDGERQILIKRLPGLEDSSRYWSIYMTLEHLRIVNSHSIAVITSLINGVKPAITPSTAAVKPQEGIAQSVVQEFRQVCEEFQNSFPESTPVNSQVTLAHPWFGELNARQWHFFAGFHMGLHRKQIEKIIEGLNDR